VTASTKSGTGDTHDDRRRADPERAERFAFGMVVRMNPRSVDIPLMLERVVWDRMFGGRRADRTAAIEWSTAVSTR
jgi:hypothetical protein